MIVVLDIGLGNLLSVAKAFDAVAIGAQVKVSQSPFDLKHATHIVLPGVGNFRIGMRSLCELGLVEPLREQVLGERKPFLGICLGMQLLADVGEEYGLCDGLGFIPGRVRRLDSAGLPLPHLGWNNLDIAAESKLLDVRRKDRDYYFVHSFVFDCPERYILAWCTYGEKFAAAVQNGNIFGTQFHPEKSRSAGLDIIAGFLKGEECSRSVWFLSSS